MKLARDECQRTCRCDACEGHDELNESIAPVGGQVAVVETHLKPDQLIDRPGNANSGQWHAR